MSYDKQVKYMINQIKEQCDSYLEYIDLLKECSFSDRILEDIVFKAKELEFINNMRYEKAVCHGLKAKKRMVA